MSVDPIPVALRVADVLERLGIPYVIGGSIASTLHGEPRTTMDVDFALRLGPEQVPRLCSELESDFFVQRSAVEEAAVRRVHCNVIHRDTMMKVDLYVRPDEGLYRAEIERAVPRALGSAGSGLARVATAEDTLLQKLRWFEATDGTSDRQWRDVVGILKQQGERLDRTYLRRWARELALESHLERAWSEAGLAPDV